MNLFHLIYNTFKYNARAQPARVYRGSEPRLHLVAFKRPQRSKLIRQLGKEVFGFHPHLISKSWRRVPGVHKQAGTGVQTNALQKQEVEIHCCFNVTPLRQR